MSVIVRVESRRQFLPLNTRRCGWSYASQDDPKETCAVVAPADERPRARISPKAGVHVHIVRDESPLYAHDGHCSVELEAQIALGMNAVVDKELNLSEFGEEAR
jgi:hypothetical protein